VRQVIRFVLERLYLGDVLIELFRILEELVKKSRRSRHLAGNLCEQVIKLIVAWNELQGRTPFVRGELAGFAARGNLSSGGGTQEVIDASVM
jgi:hypothetical protein